MRVPSDKRLPRFRGSLIFPTLQPRARSLAVLSLVLGTASVLAAADSSASDDFSTMDISQLAQVRIISVSKRAEPISRAPAAVSVLTGEEIHRLGVTTIPDALRYLAGLDVAMVSSSQWGVGARGFAGQFANQLLVMVDGRSVYDPAFGAVFWAAQDVLLEDVDRIEVVRGPGGTLWGANAVNGVVNILTKNARQTQGTLLTASGGSFYETGFAARHGFQISTNTFGRFYVKYDQYGDTPLTTGGGSSDYWERLQGGFRTDYLPDEQTTVTLQGDAYWVGQDYLRSTPNFTPPRYSSIQSGQGYFSGANFLSRWTRQYSEQSSLKAQLYYDYFRFNASSLNQRQQTVDAEVQHDLKLHERHAIAWGLGGRLVNDEIAKTGILRIPGRSAVNDFQFNVFAQDEIALVADQLYLTLGSKLEHNDYTGWELQPNGRLRWHPTEKQTVWGAVSRAVSTPGHLSSGVEYDLRVLPPNHLGPGSPATLSRILGQVDEAEELTAYELGYRIQPIEALSFDLAGFYNDYDALHMLRPGRPDFASTPPVLPISWVNGQSGRTHGLEFSAGWQVASYWRLQGSYSWFESDVLKEGLGRANGDGSPHHKFTLRSSWELGRQWELDAGLRWVDALASTEIPAYMELDVRLAWKPRKNLEVALVGQNLLDDAHLESVRGVSPLRSEVPRSVYGKVTWRF